MSYSDPYHSRDPQDPYQQYPPTLPIAPEPYAPPPQQQYSAPPAYPYSGPPAPPAYQPPGPAAYPVSPYGAAYQPPIMMAPVRPASGVSVWSLVMGLVGFFAGWCLLGIPCIIAIVLGHAGLSDTRDGVKSGRGMAVAGLALGYVTIAPAVILFFWVVVGGFFSAATVSTSP
jgi:hypothetical protein